MGSFRLASTIIAGAKKLAFFTTLVMSLCYGSNAAAIDFEKSGLKLTPEERVWLASHPVIEILTTKTSPPYQFLAKDGKVSGILGDYTKALRKRFMVDIQLSALPNNEFLSNIERGEPLVFGFLGTYGVNPQWPYQPTTSALKVYKTLFAKGSQRKPVTPDQLKGKTIVVPKWVSLDLVKELDRDNEIIFAKDRVEELDVLLSGKADYALDLDELFRYHLRQGQLTTISDVYTWPVPDDVVFLVHNDAPLLHAILNKAIADIEQHELPNILHRWYGHRVGKQQLNLTKSERDWLSEHPVIRVHNEQNWAPFNYNEHGNPKGYSIDYMNLLAERLGITVEYVSGPTWAEFLDMIKAKELDVMLNVVNTVDRRAYINFTDDYFRSLTGIYVRKDSLPIRTLHELEGKTVSLPKGFYHEELISRHYPLINMHLVEDNLKALEAVLLGKADAALSELAVTKHLLLEHSITELRLSGKVSDTRFDNILNIGVRKDWPIFREILQKAKGSITYREESQLREKWLSLMGVDKGVSVELTNEEREWLVEHPKVQLVTDKTAVPYSYVDEEGQFAGILADVCARLETLLEINFDFETVEYHELVEHVKKNDKDLISLIDPLDAPFEENYLKTQDIVYMPFALFARENSELQTHGLNALSDKRVAILKGWDLNHPALETLRPCKFIFGNTPLECVNLVLQNKADAVFEVASLIINISNQQLIQNIRLVHLSKHGMPLTFFVKKEWSEFHSALNKALGTLGPDDRIALLKKWNAYEESSRYRLLTIDLTEEERRWLKEHPIVRVVMDPYWAPVEFRDDKGNYQGISMDYLNRLEELLGLRFKITKSQSWSKGVEALRNKRVDMAASMAWTPEREDFALFTKPNISMPINIFARNDISYIGSLDNLEGKSVVVLKDYAITEWLERDYPEIRQVKVETAIDALKMVGAGEVDAFVGNVVTASYYIGQLHLNHVRVAGETHYSNDQAMAVRNDWAIFAGILQKALDNIEQQERDTFFNRWMSIKYEHDFNYAILWRVLIVVAMVFAAILYWNTRLDGAVKKRTGELKKAQKELIKHRDHLEEMVQERTRELAFTKFAFDNAPDAIEWLHGDNATMVYVNDYACKLLGYSQKELLKLSVFDFDPVYTKDTWPAFLNDMKRKGPMTFESIWEQKNGVQFPVEISARALTYQGEEYFIAFIRDISQQKQAQDELRKAKEDAELANEKLKELDRLKSMFIASMSHELRTPLNSIIGFTSMTLDELSGELNEEQKDNLRRVYKSAKHLLNLITEVIDISKIEAGRIDIFLEDVLLSEIVDEAIGTVQSHSQEKNLNLEVQFPKELTLRTDRKRLLQCLLNFLSNAVKYSEEGTVTLRVNESDSHVVISVSDTGIGIAKENIPKLFEAFERFESHLKIKAGGTGLGLYLTRKIATEILGGEIAVNSEEGKGSTFTMKIPKDYEKVQRDEIGERGYGNEKSADN